MGKFAGTKRGRAAGEDGVYRNGEWGNCRTGWYLSNWKRELWQGKGRVCRSDERGSCAEGSRGEKGVVEMKRECLRWKEKVGGARKMMGKFQLWLAVVKRLTSWRIFSN